MFAFLFLSQYRKHANIMFRGNYLFCRLLHFDISTKCTFINVNISSSQTLIIYIVLAIGNVSKDKHFLLLFISYKFVKGFLAIPFLLLVSSNWNFHDVCQRFLYNQEQNFIWIRQKMRNFPIDPHYKNRPHL